MASAFALLALDESSDDSDANEREPLSASPVPVRPDQEPDGDNKECWRPRGLISIRNTCFVNCILQALLGCARFRELLSHLECMLKTQQLTPSQHPICCCLASLKKQMTAEEPPSTSLRQTAQTSSESESAFQPSKRRRNRRQKKPPVSPVAAGLALPWNAAAILPTAMDESVRIFSKHALGQHQDAHEFLHFLCQSAHEELASILGTAEPCVAASVAGDQGWQSIGSRNRKVSVTAELAFQSSVVSAVFGGRFQTELHKKGTSDSLQYAPFFIVSLAADCGSVGVALARFTSAQRIDGLRHGLSRITADATVRFDSVPPVLLLHFKRFCVAPSGKTSKIEHQIDFQQQLTLPRRCLSSSLRRSGSTRTLWLKAVVVHSGESLSHGHYISYVLHSQMGWLAFNDAQVDQVTWDSVRQQQAYLLVYEADTALAH